MKNWKEYTDAEISMILLEHRFCYSADEVCKKWQITRYRLREWKKEYRYEYLPVSLENLVIAALRRDSCTISGIIKYVDWQDHSRLSEQEVVEILEGLKKEGIAKEQKEEEQKEIWLYNKAYSSNDSSFIFKPNPTYRGV